MDIAIVDDLKLMYVAVTRAKKRFIVYDEPEGPHFLKRKLWDSIWYNLGVIEEVNS
jgi:hypothetical protein